MEKEIYQLVIKKLSEMSGVGSISMSSLPLGANPEAVNSGENIYKDSGETDEIYRYKNMDGIYPKKKKNKKNKK